MSRVPCAVCRHIVHFQNHNNVQHKREEGYITRAVRDGEKTKNLIFIFLSQYNYKYICQGEVDATVTGALTTMISGSRS